MLFKLKQLDYFGQLYLNASFNAISFAKKIANRRLSFRKSIIDNDPCCKPASVSLGRAPDKERQATTL